MRVVGDHLRVSYNPALRPVPIVQPTQQRTLHAWGDEAQARLARLRVLVVGAGSVGPHIIEALARTGVEHIAVMDFDRVEVVNLDRLHGATHLDALLRRPKVDVARRILRHASTAADPRHETLELGVCERAGLQALPDFDVVFSCVDRPWPRHVLNTVAYADLVPVIDGGLRIDAHPAGGLRNAVWRSHVVTAGRPCLACIGQYRRADVQLERDGSLDDPSYVAGLPPGSPLRGNQNVSILSIAAASGLLNQFLALALAPAGVGDPGPLRHDLATHHIEPVGVVSCEAECPYTGSVGDGDRRLDPTGHHAAAEQSRAGEGRAASLLRSAALRLEAGAASLTATVVRLAGPGR